MATQATAANSRDALILGLYARGEPVAEIADRAGVCVKTVRNVARRAGLPARNRSHPERDALIVDAYARGDPVTEIAATYDVGRPWVWQVAKRAGLPPRRGWQRRYPLNEAAFDNPDCVGWWLIGLLAADGSIHGPEHRISLCQTLDDRDVLEAFYGYLGCPSRPLTLLRLSAAARARQYPRRPAAEARVFSARLVKALERHGVTTRKTRTLRFSDTASRQPAVWLGLFDGDGSAGIYGDRRAPVVVFFGTEAVMRQCERFWRNQLGYGTRRPAAGHHRVGLWRFSMHGEKARDAARHLLAASPVSMRRKRATLTQVAGHGSRPNSTDDAQTVSFAPCRATEFKQRCQ